MSPKKKSAFDQIISLRGKFARLKEIQRKLSANKVLYQEHDRIVEELLPLFIEETNEGFKINREISVGTKKYRFNPAFFNTKEGLIKAKNWKSAAFPVGFIE
jgi:hypothetical protein